MLFFFFSSRRRHTRSLRDWSSDVCSSDLGAWKTWEPMGLLGRDVHHATLGIIGLGGIGAEVAKRARGFDMRLLYHSRHRKPELEERLRLEYRPMDDLLREADFVSLHCALTPETL